MFPEEARGRKERANPNIKVRPHMVYKILILSRTPESQIPELLA